MNQAINTWITGLNNVGQGFWNYAVDIFIQSSVLIILLLIIDLLLRKRVRAIFRYCLWMLVLIKLIMPVSFTLPTGIGYWMGDHFPNEVSMAKWVPQTEEIVLTTPNVRQDSIPLEPVMTNETAVTGIELKPICWQGWVFLGWLVGMLVLLALLVQRIFSVTGLIAQGRPANKRLLDMLHECCCQIGIRQNIELRLSDNALSPAVCGLFKPMILIPAKVVERLSREKLKTVLIHELAHIKRADVWVNLVQTMLQIVYFYNPLVWLANGMIRRVREQAVDEMVLVTLKPETTSYSNTLIDVAEMAFWKPNLSLRLIGIVETKRALQRRIKHILSRPIPEKSKVGIVGLMCITILGFVLLPMAKAQKNTHSKELSDHKSEQIEASDINAKVTQLDMDNAALDDVIQIFGEPEKYLWGRKTFTKDNLPRVYIAKYPAGFGVVMVSGRVSELRFESGAAGYVFRKKIRIGSSLEHVLEVLGKPRETAVGESLGNLDGILYKDINGRKGHCYYRRADQNVRIFFGDYKVAAIYVTRSNNISGKGNTSSRFRGGRLNTLPKYNPNASGPWKVDLRSYDLTKLDLTNSLNDLLHASFDDRTLWPGSDHMPKDFDWKQIMEIGKNPGLCIRSLHDDGITGRGVSIAIIDQALLTQHVEYADSLKLYEKVAPNPREGSTMHGAAVASIAVGKTVGVAPGADLYYIASRTTDWQQRRDNGKIPWNFTYYAQAVERVLEINQSLPEKAKIRVISMQIGWNEKQKGYEDIMKAVQKAKAEGILVICSSVERIHGFKFHGLGRFPMADPDVFESYEPGLFWAKGFYKSTGTADRLLIPMDSRTTANFTGKNEYVFYREGGWSWSTPYIAGVYALAVQVDPNVTPERFWALAMKTGRTIKLGRKGEERSFGPILDPVRLITTLQMDR
jgi:beta-lactamase regulating signal transducer with metallopeptidase domain